MGLDKLFSGKNKVTNMIDNVSRKHKIAKAVVTLTGMSMASVVGAMALYDSFFQRYNRPDYSLKPGIYCYERAKDVVEREEFFFPANDVNLKGYYYPAQNSSGLVVVSHGLHAGADDYLPIIIYMVQNGFSVFAYDGRGTYDSEGSSTVGLCQALVDLDCALGYIQKTDKYKDMPLFLIGHSCGGYAATSVLSLKKNIKACAAIAPPNNCYTLIREKGYQYGGILASEGLPRIFLDAYQFILFGDYTECNGVKGINSVDIPVLVAHGVDDKIISFGGQSVISHKNEITNPNVRYYIGTNDSGGHDSIWHSSSAAEYKKDVEKSIAQLKEQKGDDLSDEELAEFYKTIDHQKYSEINFALFDEIISMYKDALNK